MCRTQQGTRIKWSHLASTQFSGVSSLLSLREGDTLLTQICYFEKDSYSHHTLSADTCPQGFLNVIYKNQLMLTKNHYSHIHCLEF